MWKLEGQKFGIKSAENAITWLSSTFCPGRFLEHSCSRPQCSRFERICTLLLLLSYNRLILSILCVGDMLWSMAQLRSGQLRMVVDIVGSYRWCGQLSVLARHTHMLHCPPFPTSSWILWADGPQFALCLKSSSALDSELLPWRLLLGPICGDVVGWVRMLPTPASTLPQSMQPSTGPQGWQLAFPEPHCCRVYGSWICMRGTSFFVVSCRIVPVVFHCSPCQGEGGCTLNKRTQTRTRTHTRTHAHTHTRTHAHTHASGLSHMTSQRALRWSSVWRISYNHGAARRARVQVHESHT